MAPKQRNHRRWAVALGLIALIAVAVPLGLRGLERDSAEKAIYSLAHDIEHSDAEGACERIFPSSFLPERIARDLGRDEGPSSSRGWEAGRAECRREFRAEGAFESFGFREARIRAITPATVTPASGVTRAATARVRFEGGRERQVIVIEYRGSWKVVDAAR